METEPSVSCSKPCPPGSKPADCRVGAGAPELEQRSGCVCQSMRGGDALEPGAPRPTGHFRLPVGLGNAGGTMQGVCEPSGPRRVSTVDAGCAEKGSSSFECEAGEGGLQAGRVWEGSSSHRVQSMRVDWTSCTLTSVFTDLGPQHVGQRLCKHVSSASYRRRPYGLFEDVGSFEGPGQRVRQEQSSNCGMSRLWWVQRGQTGGLKTTRTPNGKGGMVLANKPPVAAPCSKVAMVEGTSSGACETSFSSSTEDCSKKGDVHIDGEAYRGQETGASVDPTQASCSGSDGRCDFHSAVSNLAALPDMREGHSSNGSTGGHSSLMKIHIHTCKAGCDSVMELTSGGGGACSHCHSDRSPSAETEVTNQEGLSPPASEEQSPTVETKKTEENSRTQSLSQTICHSANALELFSDSSSRGDWTSQWVAQHTDVRAAGPHQGPAGLGSSMEQITDYFSDVGVSNAKHGAEGEEGKLSKYNGDGELLRSQSNPVPVRRRAGVVNFVKKLRRRAKGVAEAKGTDARKKSSKLGWLPAVMCLGATTRVGDKKGHWERDGSREKRKKAASAEGCRSGNEDTTALISRSVSDSHLQPRPSSTCDLQHQLFCDGTCLGEGQPSQWQFPTFGKECYSPYFPDSLFSDFSMQTPTHTQFWPGLDSSALAGRHGGAVHNSDSQNLTVTWCSHTGTSLFSGFSMRKPTQAQFWPGRETLGILSSGTIERTVSSKCSPPKHPHTNSAARTHQHGGQIPFGQGERVSRDTCINQWIQQGLDAAAGQGSWSPAHATQAAMLGSLRQLSGEGMTPDPSNPSSSASPQSANHPSAPLNPNGTTPTASTSSGSTRPGSARSLWYMDAAKRCNGRWRLDNQQTDNLQGLYSFMELGWWKQGAPNTSDLVKIQVRGGAYCWTCGVLRLCEVATRLPLSGVPVTQRRLDGRTGFIMAWAEPREEGMAIMATWGEPHSGRCEDVFKLSHNGRKLVRTTTLARNGGQCSAVRWVFSRVKN